MNPKKIKRLVEASLLFALLAGIVTGLYFGLFAPKDYRDLIPAESRAVVELPYSTLSELGLFAHGKDANFNLPLNGIDEDRPAFLIITPNEYVGLVMKTKNLTRVGKDISDGAKAGLCNTPARAEGFSWTWVDKGWLIAWNEEATIVLGPGTGGERDAIRQTARQMFRADKGKSFRNSDYQDLLSDVEGDAKVYVRASAIPVPLGTMVRLGLPEGVSASKAILVGSLESKSSVGGNSLCFKGRLTSDDKDVRKLLEDAADGKARQALSVPDVSRYDIALGMCGNGTEIFSRLKKEADGKLLLSAIDNIVNTKALLSKADGEMIIAASNLTAPLPQFALRIQKSPGSAASGEKMKPEDVFADGAEGVSPYEDGFQKATRSGTICLSETDSLLYIYARETPEALSKTSAAGADGEGIRLFLHLNMEKVSSAEGEDNPLRLLGKFLPGKKSLKMYGLADGELTIKFD